MVLRSIYDLATPGGLPREAVLNTQCAYDKRTSNCTDVAYANCRKEGNESDDPHIVGSPLTIDLSSTGRGLARVV